MKVRIIPKEYECIEYLVTNYRSVLKFVNNDKRFDFRFNVIFYNNKQLRIGDHILKDGDNFIIVDPYIFKNNYEKIGD